MLMMSRRTDERTDGEKDRTLLSNSTADTQHFLFFSCTFLCTCPVSPLTTRVCRLDCARRKSLHIFECLLFETDDLIMRKNEKHVILCLLEVARIGARFGMEAPMLVQMERQIDREIAADNKAMGMSSIGTETDKMSHSISVGTENNLFDSDSEDEDNIAEEPLLVYGPQPQIITNDLKSLDEMVSEGVCVV